MQCYIAGIIPIATTELFDTVCTAILFAGSNFRMPHAYNATVLDFKQEYQRMVRDVKKQIENNVPFIDCVLFCGGEPTLQRAPLKLLAQCAKDQGLKVAVQTNGTKPKVLQELIDERLVDTIILELHAPLEYESFTKITKSSTFFVTTEEMMNSVKETLNLLMARRNQIELSVRTTIVPLLMYRKEQLLEMAFDVRELDCEWQLRPFIPSVHINSEKLRDQRQPSTEFLRDLKKACLSEYPDLQITIKRFESA